MKKSMLLDSFLSWSNNTGLETYSIRGHAFFNEKYFHMMLIHVLKPEIYHLCNKAQTNLDVSTKTIRGHVASLLILYKWKQIAA